MTSLENQAILKKNIGTGLDNTTATVAQTAAYVLPSDGGVLNLPAVLTNSVSENFGKVMEYGTKADQIAAQRIQSNYDQSSSVFINPDVIDRTMATTAVDIEDLCTTGEKMVEVKDELDSFWTAPEAGLFATSLDTVLGVVAEYLQSNDNIAQNAKNVTTLYRDEQAMQNLAARSLGAAAIGAGQSSSSLFNANRQTK